MHDESVSEQAFFAGAAVVQCLFEIGGRYPFNNALITTDTTNSDLDPWCTDTAYYAALAYAGGTWNTGSNVEQRSIFWHWWLLDAIPQVLLTL